MIDVPMPRAPRAPSPRTVAAIAAAAAALGITVDEYIRRYGMPTSHRRHMNPLNPKALRRAGRRVEAFAHFAKKMIRFTETHRLKGVKKGGRRR